MAEEATHVGLGTGEGAGELRTARLTLVDATGTVRAVLGPGVDGASGLHLFDSEDRLRAQLGVDPSGATNLKLHDRDGEVCAWLAAGRHGAPSLYLRGTSRHRRGVRGHAELAVDEHGCPVLSLHDSEGRPRVLLSLDERTGTASLSYADAQGNAAVLLSEEGGNGLLHLAERDERDPAVPAIVFGPDGAGVHVEPGHARGTAALGERVARLEQTETRSRGWIVVALAGAALLGALGSEVRHRFLPGVAGETGAAASGRVTTEELVLTDRAGDVRARFGVLADGTPSLRMTDPEGQSLAELTVMPDSGALLRLRGDRSSIVLAAPPGATPSLGLHDGPDVIFQAPSGVARFPPPEAWP